jgi:hypothetical protein
MVAVIYGYFDDSGTDAGSPVAVMAGYVAHVSDWNKFENNTKRLFQRESIPFFRAKFFDHRQKQFKDWSLPRQLLFATEWCGYAKRHLMRGISSATIKADLADVKAKHRRFPALSPQANCMQVALDALFSDTEIRAEIEKFGLSLIIEKSSDKVDGGIKTAIEQVVGVNDLEDKLNPVTFADKKKVRGLQFADYLAYYSHRFGLTAMNESQGGRSEFLNLAQDSVKTIMKMTRTYAPNPDWVPAVRAAARKNTQQT